MGKRRTHIITDLNDDRLFPDEVKEDGENLDFSLNLTQASSLYLICQASVPVLEHQVKQLKGKLRTVYDKEQLEDIHDAIYVIKQVLKDAETIKQEVGQIINELEG